MTRAVTTNHDTARRPSRCKASTTPQPTRKRQSCRHERRQRKNDQRLWQTDSLHNRFDCTKVINPNARPLQNFRATTSKALHKSWDPSSPSLHPALLQTSTLHTGRLGTRTSPTTFFSSSAHSNTPPCWTSSSRPQQQTACNYTPRKRKVLQSQIKNKKNNMVAVKWMNIALPPKGDTKYLGQAINFRKRRPSRVRLPHQARVGNLHVPKTTGDVTNIPTEEQAETRRRNGDAISPLRFRSMDGGRGNEETTNNTTTDAEDYHPNEEKSFDVELHDPDSKPEDDTIEANHQDPNDHERSQDADMNASFNTVPQDDETTHTSWYHGLATYCTQPKGRRLVWLAVKEITPWIFRQQSSLEASQNGLSNTTTTAGQGSLQSVPQRYPPMKKGTGNEDDQPQYGNTTSTLYLQTKKVQGEHTRPTTTIATTTPTEPRATALATHMNGARADDDTQ